MYEFYGSVINFGINVEYINYVMKLGGDFESWFFVVRLVIIDDESYIGIEL